MPPVIVDPEASIDTGLLWLIALVLLALFTSSFFVDALPAKIRRPLDRTWAWILGTEHMDGRRE